MKNQRKKLRCDLISMMMNGQQKYNIMKNAKNIINQKFNK